MNSLPQNLWMMLKKQHIKHTLSALKHKIQTNKPIKKTKTKKPNKEV